MKVRHEDAKTRSMKQACYLLQIFFFIICFSCNNPEKSKAYLDSVNAAKKDSVNAAINPGTDVKKDSAKPVYTESENHVSGKSKEFALMESETIGELQYGQTEKKVISIMGNPDEKTEPEYWGADGLYHSTWTYHTAGVEIGLAGDSAKITVDHIRVNEKCTFKTSRNIGIGMSYDKVKEAYRNEIPGPDTGKAYIIAGSIYGGVIFTFQDDKLISVFVGASAE